MPFDYEGRCWSARLGIVAGRLARAEFDDSTVTILNSKRATYVIRVAV